jgi:hypothetical protein
VSLDWVEDAIPTVLYVKDCHVQHEHSVVLPTPETEYVTPFPRLASSRRLEGSLVLRNLRTGSVD